MTRSNVAGALEGKGTIIAGAAGDVGRATALLFATEGARIVLTDIDADGLVHLAEELEELGTEVRAVATDVRSAADCEAAVATALDAYGSVDVLFNVAGVLLPDDGDLGRTTTSAWAATLDVNLGGVWMMCRAIVPAMKDTGGGAIVNCASVVALRGSVTSQLAYTASKGAVVSLTRELAVRYARDGIRVNAVCPGPLEGRLIAPLLANDEERQRRLRHIPLGRFGKPAEVARAALWLASDDSSYTTGSMLLVDGGLAASFVAT